MTSRVRKGLSPALSSSAISRPDEWFLKALREHIITLATCLNPGECFLSARTKIKAEFQWVETCVANMTATVQAVTSGQCAERWLSAHDDPLASIYTFSR